MQCPHAALVEFPFRFHHLPPRVPRPLVARAVPASSPGLCIDAIHWSPGLIRDNPSVRQIECFIAVSECGSFRAASDRLGVSQPSVTAQIAALEKLLDVKLFERARSGALLSPAGRTLLGNARRIIQELNGLRDQADEICNRPGGTYRFGVTPTLGPYVLPHLLPDLHRQYPHLRLFIREHSPAELAAGLQSGLHDLALVPLPFDTQGISYAPLFREPIKLVIAQDHPLARRASIVAADLKNADILTIEEHHLFYRQIEELCQRIGARAQRDYHGTSLDALRHMVVMGLGHAFLPALYILSEIHDQSQLKIVDIADERLDRLHALAWRTTSPARAYFQQLAGDMRATLGRRLGRSIALVE